MEEPLSDFAVPKPVASPGQAQLDRIETKLDEVLAFRDLIMETAAPFLTGGKSKVWLALLAKSRGGGRA